MLIFGVLERYVFMLSMFGLGEAKDELIPCSCLSVAVHNKAAANLLACVLAAANILLHTYTHPCAILTTS